MTANIFARQQLDRLGIGMDRKAVHWGSRMIVLPPSQLKE
jgi:hypothetical protein